MEFDKSKRGKPISGFFDDYYAEEPVKQPKLMSEAIDVSGTHTPPVEPTQREKKKGVLSVLDQLANVEASSDRVAEPIVNQPSRGPASSGSGFDVNPLLIGGAGMLGALLGGGDASEGALAGQAGIKQYEDKKERDGAAKLKAYLADKKSTSDTQSKLDMYLRQKADKAEVEKLKATTKADRDKVVDTDKLRKEIGGSKDVKDHQVIEANYQNIGNLIEKGKYGDFTKADDIALIFSFMKMLDPSSVVREGEQATVANSGTIPETIRALYNKTLVTGEILPPEVRWDYIKQSNSVINAKRKDISGKLSEYEKLAKKRGMDSEDLILGRFGKSGTESLPEYVKQNGWIYEKSTGKAIKQVGK